MGQRKWRNDTAFRGFLEGVLAIRRFEPVQLITKDGLKDQVRRNVC